MKTSNPVFQVLVTSGNQALMAKDKRPWEVLAGQLGFIDYHTGLSFDAATVAALPGEVEFYMIVGINRGSTPATVADDVNKSTGQLVQRRRQEYVTVKPTMPEVGKVVEVNNFSVMCETEYGIKVEFRNQQSYSVNGFNQFAKYFSTYSGCCPPTACDECDKVGDPLQVATDIVNQINADSDKLLTASLVSWKIGATITAAATGTGNTTATVGTTTYQVPVVTADSTTVVAQKIAAQINTQAGSPYTASNSGAVLSIYSRTNPETMTGTFAVTGQGVTAGTITAATKTAITDPTAFATANPGANAAIRITGVVGTRAGFNGSIPDKYYKGGSDFIVSLKGGFGLCNGEVDTITKPQFPEGKGYDLQALEYEAGGWNGKTGPYRQNAATGLQRQGFEYFINSGADYTQVIIGGEQNSVSGARTYDSDNMTIIAVPCADTATTTALLAMVDALFKSTFAETLTDEGGTMGCTGNVAVTNAASALVDGIVSLS